jgi:hypothetical protein
VSAFRGKNLKQGALSGFLDAVREKRVAQGSYSVAIGGIADIPKTGWK